MRFVDGTKPSHRHFVYLAPEGSMAKLRSTFIRRILGRKSQRLVDGQVVDITDRDGNVKQFWTLVWEYRQGQRCRGAVDQHLPQPVECWSGWRVDVLDSSGLEGTGWPDSLNRAWSRQSSWRKRFQQQSSTMASGGIWLTSVGQGHQKPLRRQHQLLSPTPSWKLGCPKLKVTWTPSRNCCSSW